MGNGRAASGNTGARNRAQRAALRSGRGIRIGTNTQRGLNNQRNRAGGLMTRIERARSNGGYARRRATAGARARGRV